MVIFYQNYVVQTILANSVQSDGLSLETARDQEQHGVVCNCCSGGFKMIPKISHSAPEMSPRAGIRCILSHKLELFSLNKKHQLQ